MQLNFLKIPLFKQTLHFLSEGMTTKAHRTNREYTAESIDISALSETEALCVFDPQTSGGLFLSVDPQLSQDILQKLKSRFPQSEIIGQVKPRDQKALIFSK